MRGINRLWAVVGLAVNQLRSRPTRTALAVVGIALAVLSMTLLASVGFGVLETGQQKFDASDRELWVTGGPITFRPSSNAPITNTVVDAHGIATELTRRETVLSAHPMAFQTVYVGRNRSSFRLVSGVGIPNVAGPNLELQNGTAFSPGDPHYADGTYTGPMTYELIIDPRIARLFDVSVGETLYIGGSKAAARQHAFTVVGISPSFSQFLRTPTVTVPLSEFQEITGTTGADRATLIAVNLRDGVDPLVVQEELQAQYPEHEIRTNREQLRAIAQQKAFVIVSAGVLVVVAVVTGLALTILQLALVVHLQKRVLAALQAIGISRATLVGLVGSQGVLLGLAGGTLGLATTPAAVWLLNRVVERLVGFDSLLRTPESVYALGIATAVGIGTISAMVAAWQLARLPSLPQLER